MTWTCKGTQEEPHVPLANVEGKKCQICSAPQPGSGMRDEPRPIPAAEMVNRFKFHPANEDTGPKHQEVRQACFTLAEILDGLVPDGRELSTAITKLEEVMMWANAGIARNS